ncbi:MAG TPA: FAD-dependent oxidoreductase, partial [Candidatus Aquicultor sp.]
MVEDRIYDVVVIGAGHAGCEAALAAARMGAVTLLLTISLDTIAILPCNTSIGGPGRGQLVREIDALGGEMARRADACTLHSRRSNTAKGLAVQAPFVIVDRRQYQLSMKFLLERTENLSIRQALIVDIRPTDTGIAVTSAFGERFAGKTVVLTAGTFLGGEIAYGKVREPAGRHAEIAAPELSVCLSRLGIRMGRFKTGTSPRINAATTDVAALEVQAPDPTPEPFSFWTREFTPQSLVCYKTKTTEATGALVVDNMEASPLFTTEGRHTGARYCPSIEDRVVHSPDRSHHPIFLQPQDDTGQEYYIQGLSTSLPADVQVDLVHSIKGLEHARIMRPGYAVTYDFLHPDQLSQSLEVKTIPGLFTAGQVNGTSGYEEAAAQGLIAGINAVRKVRSEEPFILDRSQAYIGVLIDDLVTKGV